MRCWAGRTRCNHDPRPESKPACTSSAAVFSSANVDHGRVALRNETFMQTDKTDTELRAQNSLLATLPAVSVATMMAVATLATAPFLRELVPPQPAVGNGLSDLFKSAFAASVNGILMWSAMPVGGIIAGAVAGLHAQPGRIWVRGIAGMAAMAIVVTLTQVGVRFAGFVASMVDLATLEIGMLAGALLAHVVSARAERVARRTARVLPPARSCGSRLHWGATSPLCTS